MMKKYSIFIAIGLILIYIMSACHSVEYQEPTENRPAIDNIKARFIDEDGVLSGEFIGVVQEGSDEIVIQIPYFFPENSDNQVTEEMMRDMKVEANVFDNTIIQPSLNFLDLTKEHVITVINQRKVAKEYTLRAEVVKSTKAEILEFVLPSLGLSGIINEGAKTISLIGLNMGTMTANISLSPHATISPDPRVTALDFDQDQELTVTAFDGISKAVYTVKKEVPAKLNYGIRSGSGTLLFAKNMNTDLGVAPYKATGLAVSEGKLVLNLLDGNSVAMDGKTGTKLADVSFGSHEHFYATSDDAGNILANNLTSATSPTLTISKKSSLAAAAEPYISWNTGGVAVGKKVSIKGSLDGDAIITAPITATTTPSRFARWEVTGGVLKSQTPDLITITGRKWTSNADIIYMSGDDTISDYLIAAYPEEGIFTWMNGTTNAMSKHLAKMGGNFFPNAVDIVDFNNAKYSAFNFVNGFTWGSADQIWMLDVTTDSEFTGNVLTNTCKAVVWESDKAKWGANAAGGSVNNTYYSDVIFSTSDDGYFLYLYFMFGNGFVVGYQFDCVEM